MYKYLLKTMRVAKNSLRSLELFKFEKGQVCRFAKEDGVRSLYTTSVRLSDNKSGVPFSNQDEKPNENREHDPTETPPLVHQKFEVGKNTIIMAKDSMENEKPVKSETDDGVIPQPTVNTKQQKQPETPTAKSEKESLLDLLKIMKVEVTNKRKVNSVQFKQSYQSLSTSKMATLESTISMFQQATLEASAQSKTLNPELIAAASAAASTLKNSSQAESELLRKMRQHESITETQRKGDVKKLGGLIADMKIGKKLDIQNTWAANPIRFDDDGRGYTPKNTGQLEGKSTRKNLLSEKRINIFSPSTNEEAEPTAARPSLWDIEFANQLSMSVNHQLRNGLEEMVQWTKEGKLWQYPINNEDGLEEEASISFYEHVFLEKHLEEGFPHQGPVRHFMELVVAGLSKNPYLTVQQKKDHIFWFRDYFSTKEEVLKEADIYLN